MPIVPVTALKKNADVPVTRRPAHIGNALSWTLAVIVVAGGAAWSGVRQTPWPIFAASVVALLVLLSLQVANAWERAVVLRAGRFTRLAGPGWFVKLPIIDGVTEWVDQRVQTTAFT